MNGKKYFILSGIACFVCAALFFAYCVWFGVFFSGLLTTTGGEDPLTAFLNFFIVPIRWLILLTGIVICSGAAVFYTVNGIFYLKLLRKPNTGTGASALFPCTLVADVLLGLIAGFICVIWIAHEFDSRENAECVLLGVLPFFLIAFNLICNRLSAKAISARSA